MRTREYKNVICRAMGCRIAADKKGLCNKHYLRLHRHGDFENFGNYETDAERYWSTIKRVEECWEWQGQIGNGGYGIMYADKKLQLAHRWAYRHFYKEDIPKNIDIDHICENRKCVNPHHLQLLTRINNCLKRDRKPYELYECDSKPSIEFLERFSKNYPPMKVQSVKHYCAVEGCNEPCHGAGYCNIHYRRFKKHGDPMLIQLKGRYRRLPLKEIIVKASS